MGGIGVERNDGAGSLSGLSLGSDASGVSAKTMKNCPAPALGTLLRRSIRLTRQQHTEESCQAYAIRPGKNSLMSECLLQLLEKLSQSNINIQKTQTAERAAKVGAHPKGR